MSCLRAALLRLALVLLGLSVAVVLLESAMRTAGWALEEAQSRRNQVLLDEGRELRILCLGESTTLGDPLHLRYPDALQEILDAQELGTTVTVINRGEYGIQTDRILRDLEANLDRYDPRIVVTMMGINDAGRTHAWGNVIAPGRGHWYGELRVYKLYRLLRVALEAKISGQEDPFELEVGDGIEQVEPSSDLGATTTLPTSHSAVDDATAEQFVTARELLAAGRPDEAEALLSGIVRRQPQTVPARIELFHLYSALGRPERGHRLLLETAAELPLPSIDVMEALAHSHADLGQYDEALAILYDLRRDFVRPDDWFLQIHYTKVLAGVYERAGDLEAAEAMLLEVVEELSPGGDSHYRELIDFYRRHGRTDDAERYRELQRRIRHQYVNPDTRRNYLELGRLLAERGITHVAVQYPCRRVQSLQRLLDHDPRPIYVDNGFFAELVQRDGYDTYFIDRFAGNFGHMSSLGHELLAENIARAIVERSLGLEFDEAWRGADGGPAARFEAR